jgi:hypothetical protein
MPVIISCSPLNTRHAFVYSSVLQQQLQFLMKTDEVSEGHDVPLGVVWGAGCCRRSTGDLHIWYRSQITGGKND